MKIIVLGWYGHHNIGDEAYKIAFPKMFEGCDLVFREEITERDNADLIILGGGDVVSSFFIKEINKIECDKIAFSVTITEGSAIEELSKTFKEIYVRDNQSFRVASHYFPFENLHYIPDMTFCMRPDIFSGQRLMARVRNELDLKYNKTVLININSYIGHFKHYSTKREFSAFIKMSQDIAEVIDDLDVNCIFLPFGTKAPDDDRVTNGFVNACCSKQYKNVVIYDKFDVQETMNLISASDVIISSRLHATIFATICGTPFIDITHHSKNLGFLSTINKLDWSIPFWKFDMDKLKLLLETHLHQPNVKELIDFTEKARGELNNACLRLLR